LIQHYCGDAGPAEAAGIDAHLAECADCGRVWEEIAQALTMVDQNVPDPPAGFERVMWARVHQTLMAAPVAQPSPWRPWALAAGLAAIVTAAALVPARTTLPAGDAADRAALQERVLYTALDSHLSQAELLLVELRNAPEDAGFAFERAVADDLVADGRLYRLTAAEIGRPGLVRVLDDLELVFIELARSQDLDAARLAWLRSRIDHDDLLFKVRVANYEVRDRVAFPIP
jgi:predicted anti-sigma-YlaC factor YlaD